MTPRRRERAEPEPPLMRGKLFTLRRRCGTATCRCVSGDAHESPALAYPEAGRTKTLTLTEDETAEVAAALERYAVAKAALDSRAAAGLAGLLDQVSARRRRPA